MIGAMVHVWTAPWMQDNWLRVSGTTKAPQIDERVRHQLHAVVALLDELEPQQ
jgi:hypothetical protein